MSRFRQGQGPGSAYVTRAGWRTLERELEWLWRVRRPEVTRAVAEAAAMGDRSENAEYIYGKRQLREIDRRIRYLSKRLDALTVVYAPPGDRTRIRFGAWITLEGDAGESVRYRIVGPDEIDPDQGLISVDSPVARALLGKAVDDTVTVELPAGRAHYRVTAITYDP